MHKNTPPPLDVNDFERPKQKSLSADYWRLESYRLGETSFTHFPDATAHKNRTQGNDFVQSLMYNRGVTCFSCHDAQEADERKAWPKTEFVFHRNFISKNPFWIQALI